LQLQKVLHLLILGIYYFQEVVLRVIIILLALTLMSL